MSSEASSDGISLILLILLLLLSCCCCMLCVAVALWMQRKKKAAEAFNELDEIDVEKEGATAGGSAADRSSMSEYPHPDRAFSMPQHSSTSLTKTLSSASVDDEDEDPHTGKR